MEQSLENMHKVRFWLELPAEIIKAAGQELLREVEVMIAAPPAQPPEL